MNAAQRRKHRRDAGTAMTFRRDMRFDGAVDVDARTVSASLSSATPVQRYGYTEILPHDAQSVDLSRADGGLPLLVGHDHGVQVGIVEGLSLDGDRLRGTLRLSRSALGGEILGDIADGIRRSMSVGYTVDGWNVDKGKGTKTATRWTPFEASIVSIPADHSVGINRSEGTDVTDHTEGHEVPETQTRGAAAVNVIDYEQARARALREGEELGRKREMERIDGLQRWFTRVQDPRAADLLNACVRNGTSIEDGKGLLLDLIGSGATPTVATRAQSGHSVDREVSAVQGEDAIDKAARGMEESIALRAGIVTDKDQAAQIRSGGYAGMSLSEMAREWCRVAGVDVSGDKRSIVGRAFTRAVTHGTSDFTSVLANVTTKALLMGYEEAPETWAAWCRVGSLPDFKQAYRVQTSAFGDLATLTENAEYSYGTVGDHHEPITLASYGKMFSISRQAIINDDVSAFVATSRGMGRAAARKVGDLAYGVLTAGDGVALTQDNVNLFDVSTHANYLSTGTAVSVASLNVAYAAMAVQTDPTGAAYLNITPEIIIAPHALRGTIDQLIASAIVPAATASSGDNVWRAKLSPVYDARLDADDPAAWYLSANPSQFDTVEVAFLDGIQAPYLEEREGWSVDGVEYKVRIDAAAKALDFRGLYRNDGN